MYEDHLYIQWFWFAGGPEGSEIMAWEKSPFEKCSTRYQTLLRQCNEHWFAFFGIPSLESFFRRRQASPVPPRLQVQPWEDKGETWPLQLVQVETNLNAIYILFSVWRESVRVGLIFVLEKKMAHSGPAFLTGLSRGTHRDQFSRKFSTLGESLIINLQQKS